MVADALAERWGLGRPRERFRGRIAEGRAGGPSMGMPALGAAPRGQGGARAGQGSPHTPQRVAVLWPQTFMNDAGRSVGPARGSYRLPLERVVVVHDEIDLPFGEIRSRLGGGLAGHNGLKSLRRELGGADFRRVRVGVGRPDSTDPEVVSAHVLGCFAQSPEQVRELVARARDEVERVVLEEGDGVD
jgi:peptidyl-tRNA hydrolase, PTH1 family